MPFKGAIFAALLTPMDAAGQPDNRALPALVDHVLSLGVDGLYAGGSTGEAMLQSRQERAEHLTALAEHARGTCTLIAHVGAAATGDAEALSALARENGYDAVSAVPPYYYKHSFADIAAYYRAIADASDLPVIIYNIPALTGTDLSTPRLLDLMRDDRIIGAKFTAQDLFQFQQLRAAAPGKRFYFGTDEMFLAAAAMGTDGGIGSTYNLIGDVYVGIAAALEAGDIEAARALQEKANALVAILLEVGVLPGLKHALNRIGVPVGPPRAPFKPLDADGAARIDAWLDTHGYLA